MEGFAATADTKGLGADSPGEIPALGCAMWLGVSMTA